MRKAFAYQANSDLRVYELLCTSSFPMCHRLHYLQMSLEKLSKAHQWSTGVDPGNTHNVVAKILPTVIREHWRRVGNGGKPSSWQMTQIREICREVDLLHPIIDDEGRRPDNCEYPWSAQANVHTPAKYPFRVADRINSTIGASMLKIASLIGQQLQES